MTKHLQAAGRVSFPSALYHPYNIHAVGVQTESVLRRNRFSWQHIGRFTENVLRSVNNLEERSLVQTYDFHFMFGPISRLWETKKGRNSPLNYRLQCLDHVWVLILKLIWQERNLYEENSLQETGGLYFY